jgi:hypothetical protein
MYYLLFLAKLNCHKKVLFDWNGRKEIHESRESANMLRYAYTASLVKFVERRVVFSFFTVKCVLSVKTLRFYGLISLYSKDSAMETDLISGRPVSSCSNKQVYVSFLTSLCELKILPFIYRKLMPPT